MPAFSRVVFIICNDVVSILPVPRLLWWGGGLDGFISHCKNVRPASVELALNSANDVVANRSHHWTFKGEYFQPLAFYYFHIFLPRPLGGRFMEPREIDDFPQIGPGPNYRLDDNGLLAVFHLGSSGLSVMPSRMAAIALSIAWL